MSPLSWMVTDAMLEVREKRQRRAITRDSALYVESIFRDSVSFNPAHQFQVLEICLRLNIPCVTVYAFSINNFKRPGDEVNALMELAREKLIELSQHGFVAVIFAFFEVDLSVIPARDLLQSYGVRLNVIGRTEMLPEDLQEAIDAAEEVTRNNNKSVRDKRRYAF